MSTTSIFGTLSVSGQDMAWPEVKFDRLAVDDCNRLLFASILADSGLIKGIRAALNSDKRVTMTGRGVTIKKASANDYYSKRPDNIAKGEDKYTVLVHRLDHGQAHALFMTRAEGFLPALTDAHLWANLNSTRYTTPLLPEWTPYIKGRLVAADLLRESLAYRCECAMLTATTGDIDLFVSEGLRAGQITIPSKLPALAVA